MRARESLLESDPTLNLPELDCSALSSYLRLRHVVHTVTFSRAFIFLFTQKRLQLMLVNDRSLKWFNLLTKFFSSTMKQGVKTIREIENDFENARKIIIYQHNYVRYTNVRCRLVSLIPFTFTVYADNGNTWFPRKVLFTSLRGLASIAPRKALASCCCKKYWKIKFSFLNTVIINL